MASLQEIIDRNRQQLANQPATDLSEAEKLKQFRSGMQGTANTAGPARQSQSELSANQLTASSLQQLGNKLSLQSQAEAIDTAGTQQQFQDQKQDLVQQRQLDEKKIQLQTDELLSSLSREKGELNMDKDRAKLEQVAFGLALQDKEYVRDLQDVGKRRRLDNAAAFQKEMEDLQFGNTVDVLRQKIGNKSIINMNEREFEQELSSMSIDSFRKIAQFEMESSAEEYRRETDAGISQMNEKARAEADRARFEAISQLGNAGIRGYTDYSEGKYDSDYKKYRDEGGQKGYGGSWRDDPIAASNAARTGGK